MMGILQVIQSKLDSNWYKFLILVCLPIHSLLYAQNHHYEMKMSVPEATLREGNPIEVQAEIRLKEPRTEVCFYLAYHDPFYFNDPSQGLDRSGSADDVNRPYKGMIEITKTSAPWAPLRPELIKLDLKPGEKLIRLDFSFVIPRWPDRLGNQFLFSQFYPKLLSSCPLENQVSYNFQLDRQVSYHINLNWPRTWQLTTTARFTDQNVIESDFDISFNLTHNYRIEVIELNETTIQLVYLSDSFRKLKRYLRNFFISMEGLVGKYPYPKLLLLETEDLERSRVPGVLTLNRPKQTGMNEFQSNFLNWTTWQLSFALAEQWFGTSIRPSNFDDFWFFRGTAEYLASLSLQREPSVYNLFSSRDAQDPWLSLTYQQGSDLAGSLIAVFEPENSLVEATTLASREPFLSRNSFSYMRHVLALRYLHWFYGDLFLNQLKEFFNIYQGKNISHRDFYQFLKANDSLVREGITADQILLKWWSSSEWPDFTLESYQSVESQDSPQPWRTKILISQNPGMILPFDVVVITEGGQRISQTVFPSLAETELVFATDQAPELIEVNPGREIFDKDRFDNSNQRPKIHFFPGDAKTLADDGYTVVWFPFPSLLPGESLSINLGLQYFRYVNAGVSGLINYIPQNDQVGLNFSYLTDIKPWKSYIIANYLQNYGKNFRNERIMGLSLFRSPLFFERPKLELGVKLSGRETMGLPETRHMIGGLSLSLSTDDTESCHQKIAIERQLTLGVESDFTYERDWAIAEFRCAHQGASFKIRGFWGNLQSSGPISQSVKFFPQTLEEARIRIDHPSLEPSHRFRSIGLDLNWPAHLPFSSTYFILPRKSKWRLSWDYGESKNLDGIYSDAGLGLTLPLGGDVVGKRSFSFFNFTAMAIFYRRYGDEVSYQPGVIFDFMGKL